MKRLIAVLVLALSAYGVQPAFADTPKQAPVYDDGGSYKQPESTPVRDDGGSYITPPPVELEVWA